MIVDGVQLLRFGVIAVLALVVGGVLGVMRLHWIAWRRLPTRPGLAPLHVALVSLGVAIWGVTLGWALVEQLGRDATPAGTVRLALYGAGGAVILASLVVVGGVQRRRVRTSREPSRVLVDVAEPEPEEET